MQRIIIISIFGSIDFMKQVFILLAILSEYQIYRADFLGHSIVGNILYYRHYLLCNRYINNHSHFSIINIIK